MSITGRIEDWELVTAKYTKSQFIMGYIYEDALKRAEDGSEIITSKLKPMSMQTSLPQEGAVIHTHNSAYLLGKPKQGESCE